MKSVYYATCFFIDCNDFILCSLTTCEMVQIKVRFSNKESKLKRCDHKVEKFIGAGTYFWASINTCVNNLQDII